jgi:hypothetical protein
MKTSRNVLRFCWLSAGAVALAFGTAGCLVIPTPHRDTGLARTNLTKLTPQQFTPGRSTMEDVVLTLGEPDAISADEHRLAYRSERTVAIWIIAVGGGYSGEAMGGGINQEQFYIFEFDSQGCLQKTTRTGKLLGDVGFDTEDLLKTMNTGETVVSQPLPDEGDSSQVPACLAGEQIQAVYPHTSWLSGVDGYRSRGAVYRIGSPDRLILTESNLYFFLDSQFANAGPALRLPLASVTGSRVDRRMLVGRLVVSAEVDQIHSFEIYQQASRILLNKPAMRDADKFMQTKIGHPRQP